MRKKPRRGLRQPNPTGKSLTPSKVIPSLNQSPWYPITIAVNLDKTVPQDFDVNTLANLLRDDIGLFSNLTAVATSRIPIALRFFSVACWAASSKADKPPGLIKLCAYSLTGSEFLAVRTGSPSPTAFASVGYTWGPVHSSVAFTHSSKDKVFRVEAGDSNERTEIHVKMMWRPLYNSDIQFAHGQSYLETL